MNVSHSTIQNLALASWVWIRKAESSSTVTTLSYTAPQPAFDLLKPLKQWMDSIEIKNPKLARLLCQLIPAKCPFERDIIFFGKTLFHIPPLCKLNPLYEQTVSLRFRALCYLADECGEDVSRYCC